MATKKVDGVEVALTAQELADFDATRPTGLAVPQSVTKLQLRKACLETAHAGSNWWALAKVALAASSADTQEEWDLASVITRDDATFTAFATALGADADDVDAVFRLAATK